MSVIENSKLPVVGAGSVGASVAYAALIRGSARHVALYDIAEAKVGKGKLADHVIAITEPRENALSRIAGGIDHLGGQIIVRGRRGGGHQFSA